MTDLSRPAMQQSDLTAAIEQERTFRRPSALEHGDHNGVALVASKPLSEQQLQESLHLALPVNRWIERYRNALVRHARTLYGSLGDEDSLQELGEAQTEINQTLQALATHRVAMVAHLQDDPLLTVVARLLTLQTGQGVDAPWSSASDLVVHLLRDDDRDRPWQTTYLMGVKVFEPWIEPDVRRAYAQLRERIVQSIGAGETDYLRDGQFDALLARLFEPLRQALSSRYGRRP